MAGECFCCNTPSGHQAILEARMSGAVVPTSKLYIHGLNWDDDIRKVKFRALKCLMISSSGPCQDGDLTILGCWMGEVQHRCKAQGLSLS